MLRDEGLVDARQGFGWFVAVDPLRQSLGRLGTIEAQLAESGGRSERRILDFGFVPAPPRVREVLGVATVLEVRRLNLADGEPFARVTVWCPERSARTCRGRRRARVVLRADRPAAGRRHADHRRGGLADADDAAVLEVPAGRRCSRCERITSIPTGGRCSSASTSSRPTAPSSWSTSRSPSRASRVRRTGWWSRRRRSGAGAEGHPDDDGVGSLLALGRMRPVPSR